MEHPVPQNVTSFEFHLVGDMTLKQFGYLAAGLIIAYLAVVLLIPVNFFLAFPVIALSSLAGAAFAFMPILDRPLDHWLKAFLTAVYSPTQGFWAPPEGGNEKISPRDPLFQNRLQIYLSSSGNIAMPLPPRISIKPLQINQAGLPRQTPAFNFQSPNRIPNPQENSLPSSLDLGIGHQEGTKNIPAPSTLPSDKELSQLVSMAKQIQFLRGRIGETEQQLQKLSTAAGAGGQPGGQISQLYTNLQSLVTQTENLYQQSSQMNKAVPPPPKAKSAKVVVVEPQKPTEKQVMITSLPNVINGIVTDLESNFLEGVIVIIHNKEGLPVRAIKTNKLGQFAGATPLPSGVYTVTLEKEGLDFDTLRVTLSGDVLTPLRISARKGGLKYGVNPAISAN